MKITEYENAKIRVIENFISKEDCDWIIKYVNSLNRWDMCNATRSQFPNEEEYRLIADQWDNRKFDLSVVYAEKKYPDLFKKIWDNQNRAKEEVLKFFNLDDSDITIECLEVVKWYYPFQQAPHVDYYNETFLDSDFPNGFLMPDNIKEVYLKHLTTKNFTTMLYLNNDFTGGELYFPVHNITIKPEPGMLVLFSGDPTMPHGINQITEGTRYVNTAFWAKTPYDKYSLAKELADGSFDEYWTK